MKLPFVATVLMWSIASMAVAIDDYPRGPVPGGGETFRASFENGPKADGGAGFPAMHARTRSTMAPEGWKFDFVEGRVGKAIDVRGGRMSAADSNQQVPADGEEASFKAQGYFCLRAGTISFWCRTNEGAPSVKITSQTNDNAVHPLLYWKSSAIEALDRTYADRVCRLSDTTLDDGQWHHGAVVWDECRGLQGYVDGESCGAAWGKNAYQTGYLSAGRLGLKGAVFDEVRVFDVALTDEHVKTLADGKGELPDLADSVSGVIDVHRLEHLGWHDGTESRFPIVEGPTLVRKILPERARAVRKSGWRVADGREDSVWPFHYHQYWYPDSRGPARLLLAKGDEFNLLRVRGTIDRASLREGDAYVMPTDTRLLAAFTGKQFVTQIPLDGTCSASAVSVYPHEDIATGASSSDRYYWSKRKELHDLSLLNVQPGGKPNGQQVLSCYLTSQGPETVAGDNRVRLIHWYRPDERQILTGAPEPGPADEVVVRPLRFFHLMCPPQSEDLPLSAVQLALQVNGWQAGNTVNVRVHDPFNLWRNLIDVDVELKQPGQLDLTLEFGPTLLPKETELWVTIVSRDGGRVRCGPDGSKLVAYGPDLQTATRAYYKMQHHILSDNFEILSEPHPWSYATKSNEHLRVALARYDAITRPMYDLYHRFPNDRWSIGYMLWTQGRLYVKGRELLDSLPDPFPEDPNAPRWALLQKEHSKLHFEFANWWIDNRQAPNGELGSSAGDDTDMLGDWPGLAMLSDTDGKIKRSQRLLTDFCWNHTMENGLNKGMTDALHAYEAGPNVQPYAALMDYGNPVLMERLLTTARRYDGFLITEPHDGKRKPAGGFFSATEVNTGSRYGKPSHDRLILHAGLYLMYYNGHPGLTRMMAEYHAGSPPMQRGRTGDLEYALYMMTGDKRYAEGSTWPGRDPKWARLLGLRTADETLMKDLLRPSKRLLRLYLAWWYDRDKKHLVDALEIMYKQLYYRMDMVTRTEQSGDRVHMTWVGGKSFTDQMYFGCTPGARNELMPLHAVSYEGLSPEFAGLVLDDTPEHLAWVGYNFESKPQTGKLRVWRLEPGTYRVRMGIDSDDDDKTDEPLGQPQMLELKRYEPISLTLPSRKLVVVDVTQVAKDPTPLDQRCDLGITHEDAVRKGTTLTAKVHNLGCVASGPFTVVVKDSGGKSVATQEHEGLDGVLDLHPKVASFTFTNMPADGTLCVEIHGPAKEITEANNAAEIAAPTGRPMR